MTQERLEEIRKRAEAATPGPWESSFPIGMDTQWFDVEDSRGEELVSAQTEPTEHIVSPEGIESLRRRVAQNRADIEFIAHSRTDVVDLLAEVERLSGLQYMEDWLRRERGHECAVRIKDDGRCSLLLSWNGRYREFDAPTIHQAIAMLQEQDG